MKKILACFLLLMPVLALGSEISCYSGKTRVYHGIVDEVEFNDDFVSFLERKTNQRIYVFAECVMIA